MKSLIKNYIFILVQDTSLYHYWRKRKERKRIKNELDVLKAKNEFDVYADPVIEVINLNADDICNSRCVMCNIWQQKKEYEISPDELETILKDPLYKNVKHIGVTGGEPTLRKDLALLFEAIFKSIGGVVGASTITNCIREEEVILRVNEVIEVCEKYNKNFSMMISLDGIGVVHERVRRREGNFQSAINVLNYFKNKGVSVITGTTISKVNVWDVDEVLDYLKENRIYGRFRVAEFIKRLYNSDDTDVIRNFDEDETYHLILFFYKLIYRFETNETFRRTYRSIISILSGGKRLIGCPYHLNGVVLNSKGGLAYCAPKSDIIGNSLDKSSLSLYKDNLQEKQRILKNDCDNCIHDYHAPITYKERKRDLDEQYWKSIIALSSDYKLRQFKKIQARKNGEFQIFITGWYGTETVGDKAILGQIIDELYDTYGNSTAIVVSSIFPIITKRTLKELNFVNIGVASVYSEEFVEYIKGSDLIVMGGGPLMDLDELSIPLLAFRLAKSANKKTIIYGCGLGPLNNTNCVNAVKELLNTSDVIKLRDNKSIELAKSWLNRPMEIELSGDPAKKYLNRYLSKTPKPKEKIILTCFLREWTFEYSKESMAEFDQLKINFEKGLASFIKKKAREIQAQEILLDHMHNFTMGNDDRDFSRYFIKTYFADFEIPISYNKKLSTINSVVESMLNSSYNICMRFHSVVFAHTLDTDFTAIDYTRGGKILNYLTDNNCPQHMLSIDNLVDNEY